MEAYVAFFFFHASLFHVDLSLQPHNRPHVIPRSNVIYSRLRSFHPHAHVHAVLRNESLTRLCLMTLICWFFRVVVYFDAYELPTLSELVEPSASSANKRAKISPPSPGSKEFQLLPAVSPTYAFSFCNFYFSNLVF